MFFEKSTVLTFPTEEIRLCLVACIHVPLYSNGNVVVWGEHSRRQRVRSLLRSVRRAARAPCHCSVSIVNTMRRAWPPVYRPTPQQKIVSAAAAPQQPQPMTTRYRRDSVATAAAAGACFVIAAPCTCSPPLHTSAGPLTVRNQQQHPAAQSLHHRGPPPPLPARNGGGCPYRGCCAPGRTQKLSSQISPISRPLAQQQQPYHNRQHLQRQQVQHQQMVPERQRCAYVKPRPSRSLENLLRVVELDDTATAVQTGYRGVYEKSCQYGNPRRKIKVTGKENRHAWKRRSMESLLSVRDAATIAAKNFELFHHVRVTIIRTSNI